MIEHTAAPGDDETELAESARARTRPLVRALQAAALLLVAGLLALLVWRVVTQEQGNRFVADIREGERPAAPAFALPVVWSAATDWPPRLRRALGDGTLTLAELRGYPVVLNFWASWCIPCGDEAPVFAEVSERYAGRVVVLGVDVQDLSSEAERFLRKHDVRYPTVRDGGGAVYDDYGLTGVPETYYVDARGRAVAHSPGAVSGETLEEGITALLAPPRS